MDTLLPVDLGEPLYILSISILICLPLWSAVWAARDAESRGLPGWMVGPLVLLFVWPLGLILWLALRQERKGPDSRVD